MLYNTIFVSGLPSGKASATADIMFTVTCCIYCYYLQLLLLLLLGVHS